MIDTTSYRDIGFCIYCGAKEPPLTREHVIPKGLGGILSPEGAHTAPVLGRASCDTCQKIIHKFETKCQRQMFRQLRLRLGLSRRDNPDEVCGILKFADGKTQEVKGNAKDFPAGIFLPLFNKKPRLWLPKGAEHKAVRKFIYKAVFDPIKPTQFEADEIQMEITWNTEDYQKMLAKIAFGSAILKYGPDYFTPIVADFIRGVEKWAVGKYIFGFDLEEENEPLSTETHASLHDIRMREHNVNGIKYVIVFTRLFAMYGAPTNAVIVGTIN